MTPLPGSGLEFLSDWLVFNDHAALRRWHFCRRASREGFNLTRTLEQRRRGNGKYHEVLNLDVVRDFTLTRSMYDSYSI